MGKHICSSSSESEILGAHLCPASQSRWQEDASVSCIVHVPPTLHHAYHRAVHRRASCVIMETTGLSIQAKSTPSVLKSCALKIFPSSMALAFNTVHGDFYRRVVLKYYKIQLFKILFCRFWVPCLL